MLLPVSILVDVALRKESVDRNLTLTVRNVPIDVALRKESVDRNFFACVGVGDTHCRSPQGERG